jgi:two-component system, OmpR family, sensor kinase
MRQAKLFFLRNILHELKTPIMKGSLITDALPLTQQSQRLQQIFFRMDHLLNEFVKIERFSSGEWEINLQEYRFVDIIDHACDLLLCEKSSITVLGKETQLIVTVDYELFAIALKNLIDNAFKYSDTTPKIIIERNKITVQSKGTPLPAEKQKFDKPFNRSFESSASGLGLGLYISNAILTKHNFLLRYRYIEGYNNFIILVVQEH